MHLLILDRKDQNIIHVYIHLILFRLVKSVHHYTIYMIYRKAKTISTFIGLAVHVSMWHLSGTSCNHSSAPRIRPNSSIQKDGYS